MKFSRFPKKPNISFFWTKKSFLTKIIFFYLDRRTKIDKIAGFDEIWSSFHYRLFYGLMCFPGGLWEPIRPSLKLFNFATRSLTVGQTAIEIYILVFLIMFFSISMIIKLVSNAKWSFIRARFLFKNNNQKAFC